MNDVVAMLERQTGLTVKCMVCDGGKEFMNAAWDEWLASTRTQYEQWNLSANQHEYVPNSCSKA